MTDPNNQNPQNMSPEQNPISTPETPQASTQIPVSEIPGEVKSLEELSGVKDPMQPEVPQVFEETPPTDSKAKLVKIVVPIVVAIALGLGGYLVYSFFIKGEPEGETSTEESTTETPVVETPTEEPVVTEEELEQSLNGQAEEVNPEETPAEDVTTEEETPPAETPKVKVPRT